MSGNGIFCSCDGLKYILFHQVHCQAKGRPQSCKPSSQLAALFPDGPLFRPAQSLCTKDHPSSDNRPVGRLRYGFCTADGDCADAVSYAGYAAGGRGAGGVIVGLIVFAVCYAIVMACALYLYCRYCRGGVRKGSARLDNGGDTAMMPAHGSGSDHS